MTQPDPLSNLRAQIRGVSEATERLVRDAADLRPPGAPRAGAAPPDAGGEPTARPGVAPELEALTRLFGLLGELLPGELHQDLAELVRELLVLLRALIDLAVTALEPPKPQAASDVEVEDIPIG